MLIAIKKILFYCLLLPSVLGSNLGYGLTVTAASTTSPALKEVVWLVEDNHEGSIADDTPSVSTSQVTARHLLKQLSMSGYEVTYVTASLKRINKLLQTHDNVCIGNRIKTPERASYSLFSKPQHLYLGLKLYRLANTTPLSPEVFNPANEIVSLPQFFNAYPNKVLGIADGASYGDLLDKQISTLLQSNLFRRSTGYRLRSTIGMLLKKRIDYVLYHPADMENLIPKDVAIESYKIAGTSAYNIGYVNCAKSNQGQGIIEDINKLLMQAYSSPWFYDAHKKWTPPINHIDLKEYYREVFKALPENTPPP